MADAHSSRLWCLKPAAVFAATTLAMLALIGIAFLTALPVRAQDTADNPTSALPVLNAGDAVVTQFSGIRTEDKIADDEHPLDRTFIDPDGVVARVLHLDDLGTPPRGQVSTVPNGLELTARDIGQVFGVALDTRRDDDAEAGASPDIYLSATSLYGLHIVSDDSSGKTQRLIQGAEGARWQDGLFATENGGTPGAIWKIDGTSGDVSLFANVEHDGKDNAGPGLGALVFDARTGMLYVSDLETGLIVRFSDDGRQRETFDHGMAGRGAIGLPEMPYDASRRLNITSDDFDSERPDTWGYARIERRVFGLAIQGGRLYYAVAEGPTIWSVSLDEDGSFGDDPRIETDLPDATPDTDITAMLFDAAGDLYLAQRGPIQPTYDYASPAETQTAPVLRYAWSNDTGTWTPETREYAIGLAGPHRATDGGLALSYGYDGNGQIDLEACRQTVWTTGSNLRDGNDTLFVTSGGARRVEGLQGVYRSKVRPDNVGPREAWFVDADSRDGRDNGAGQMGDVAIYSPCTPAESLPPGDIDPPPPYEPPLDAPGIAISKRCEATAIGGTVSCEITVRNTTMSAIDDDLRIEDLTRVIAGPDAGSLVPIVGFTVPDPLITCSAVPAEDFACTIPAALLAPGVPISIGVTVETAALVLAGNGGIRNCASIDHPLGVGMACAESGSEIVVEKIGPGTCLPNGTCKFGLALSNVGLEAFAAPVLLADQMTVGGGVANVPVTAVNPPIPCLAGNTNQLPFTCLSPLALAPGETRIHWIEVTMPAPGGYVAENCFGALDAGLFPVGPLPPPGPGGIAGNPSCVTVNVPLPSPNLAVSKAASGDGKCAKVGGNLECDYEIGITNQNDAAFIGPVAFTEIVPAGATLLPLGAPFACAAGPPNYACNSAGNIAIAPGDTFTIPARIRIPVAASEALGCRVPNKVELTVPPGGAAPNLDASDDSAEGEAWTMGLSWVDPITGVTFVMCDPTNLRVEKTARGDCVRSGGTWQCGYDVTVTNMGPDPYEGPIRLDETFAVEPQSVAFTGDFSCADTGGGAFKCETGILNLAKDQKLTIGVVATIADGETCRLDNTATMTFPLAGTRGNQDGSDDSASAAATIESPRCTRPTSTTPLPPPTTRCPDGRPAGRYGRCPCPRGEIWSASLRRCLDDTPTCVDPERRRFDGTCCPRGTYVDRTTGRCYADPPIIRCPDRERRKADGTCCPFGTFASAGGWRCIPVTGGCPPGEKWSRVAKRCLPDIIDCPRGERYSRSRGRCLPIDPKPTCPDGRTRDRDGSCPCPRGTEWNAKAGRCESVGSGPIVPPPGLPGGDRPPCKRGEIRVGKRCVPRPDPGIKPCPRGEVRIGRRCVPKPDLGDKPCKRGEIRIGKRCVAKPDPVVKPCGKGEIRIGKRCVSRPDTSVKPCPRGMVRQRGRCRPVGKPPEVRPPRVKPPRVKPPRVKPPRVGPPRVKPPRVKPPRIKPPRIKQPRVRPPKVRIQPFGGQKRNNKGNNIFQQQKKKLPF